MLIGTTRVKRCVASDPLDMRADGGGAGGERRVVTGLAARLTGLGTVRSIARNIIDAGSVDIGPCRVTASASRMVAREPAGRGAGTGVRRSR